MLAGVWVAEQEASVTWSRKTQTFKGLFLMLFFLGLRPPAVSRSLSSLCSRLKFELKEDGPMSIAIMTSIFFAEKSINAFKGNDPIIRAEWLIPKNIQHIWAFTFAVYEAHWNYHLLRNITFQQFIQDNLFSPIHASWSTLGHLANSQMNLNCYSKKNRIAVIGGLSSQNSIQMANMLTSYKIPQLIIGSFDPVLSDKIQFPSVYRMTPHERLQYVGIVQLLKRFGWTWVGLITSDDESGETFLQSLRPRLRQNNICIASVQLMPIKFNWNRDKITDKIWYSLRMNKMNVTLVHGDIFSMDVLLHFVLYYENLDWTQMQRVWIITEKWEFTTRIVGDLFPAISFNGTLSFSLHTNAVPGFQEHVDRNIPWWYSEMQRCWETLFNCFFPVSNVLRKRPVCTGEEKLRSLPGTMFEPRMSGSSYSIYNAFLAVAHALHALHLPGQRRARGQQGKRKPGNVEPWQLHAFLQNIRFNNSAGDEVFFDENGELATRYDIINTVAFFNQSFRRIKVGTLDPRAPKGQEFSIIGSAIVWHPMFNQVVPVSKCSKSCQPGSHKVAVEGKEVCCYDCIPCPQGMISVHADVNQCQKCPEDQYPNERHDRCIPRSLSFLSYGEPLGVFLVSLALSLSFVTILVMGLFLLHWDTPIVKANNRSITCTLLASLLLGFLSSLLFIGQPGKVTCLLRQTVFGITSSLSVSSVLAKTITVVMVFMATQPGNSILKWSGKRLAVSVIVLSSLIQTAICSVWVTTSPPFPELDLHSEVSQITVQCNEGSELMLYVVLGYMGLLAVLSFILAFLARRLPDSFNEAKLITFSMLLFCAVWVSFVPTYLSTKGKYMVAVEIFSILASSAGLLGCIFLPKCYIIVVRPELNTRDQLVRKKNSLN